MTAGQARTRVEADLAAEMLAAVQAGDSEAMLSCMTRALGLSRHQTVRETRPQVVIYKWICPWCDPDGPFNRGGVAGRIGGPDGERCRDCAGLGVLPADALADPSVFGPGELREVPRPPAVMRSPCVDCAYKAGSPESDTHPDMLGVGVRPDASVPFFCHHGMVRVGDGYEAPAYVGTLPLGAMVCAGWWSLATGGPPPSGVFRDPGGANRPESAPRLP